MKKLIYLFLALFSITSYGQADFPEGIQISGGQPTVTSVNYLTTTDPSGLQGKIAPNNVPITYTPINYAPSSTSIADQLAGIDTRLGQIGNTTAGITNRVYFTGDNVTVTAGTFFASNGTGKGTATSGLPTPLVNGDNQKQYFTKDLISIAQPSATTAPPGNYSGQLTVTSSPTPNGTQQRYTIEIYKTNNGGTPIASGITGAPTGNLGVTVVAILDSGLINLVAGAITNISLNGNLASTLSLATGERLRYHVSAQKVGSGGGNVTMSVLYGSDYNSYYDVTVTQKASTVNNDSSVVGGSVADALNTLNTNKANLLGGNSFTGNQNYADASTIKIGSNTSYGKFAVAGNYDQLTLHAFDDYSIATATADGQGYSSFDASRQLNGGFNHDHMIGYQARQKFNGSGSIYGAYGITGFYSHTSLLGAGNISGHYGLWIDDLTVSGIGVSPKSYGIYINDIKIGTTDNYAIYSKGHAPSTLEGSLLIGDASAIPLTKPLAQLHVFGGGMTTNLTDINTTLAQRIDVLNSSLSLGVGYLGTDDIFLQAFNNSSHSSKTLYLNPYGGNVRIGNLAGGTSALLETDTAGNIQRSATVLPTSGTYTPTLTAISNVSSVTLAGTPTYTRIGNVITVSVSFNVSVSGSAFTEFSMTLPVNMAIGASKKIGSVDIGSSVPVVYYTANGSIVNSSTFKVSFTTTNNSSCSGNFTFQYDVTQ